MLYRHPMPRPTKINNLLSSKNSEDRKLCIQLLKEYLAAEPNNAECWFDLASCHDFLGEELIAEPAYEKALSLGLENLPSEKRVRLIIQYGSTLRNNKKFKEATGILMDGIKQYPENRALRFFAALSLYSDGKHQESSRVLFEAFASLPSDQIDGYHGAVKYYVENLDNFP